MMIVLHKLMRSYEGGATALEVSKKEYARDSRWYDPTLRRLRLLQREGLAEEVRAVQSGWLAYRVTAAGIAEYDRQLIAAKKPGG